VLYELSDVVALIDPLLPSEDRAGFLRWLDARIATRAVTILTTIRWHRRDREELAERYRSSTSRAWNAVPPEIKPRPLAGAGETMFWLPAVATLVPGDRLLGAPGGLAELLRPLVQLPIERVLVSHGEPLLRDGRAALVRAIAEAKAGD
jgi:hypothetical protein